MILPEAADAYLANLAPFCGKVVGIDQVLSHFRLHGANNWSNPSGVPKEVQEIRVLQDHEFRVSMLNRSLKRLGIAL